MTNLKYITKNNNNNLKDKPRVYFTCHPQDFEQTFERLTNDIFKTQDCVIYYTENMADRLPEDSRETDLDRMNLFVIPVTKKLLDEHNRAMDEDYAFAVKHNIPVLPLKMEILKIKDNKEDMEDYNKKFSYSHYIEPDNSYNYEKKLETYLKSVLLDDGTIERIRKAFDAYIFLSYRKKDKKYAEELMSLIHSDPVCRNIAIWYDEYLIPGENFSDMIEAALDKSEIFTLLVTPNLVNESNYVRDVEYPEARKSEKPIYPAMMQDTDIDQLKSQYESIPDVIDIRSDEMARAAFIESVKHLAKQRSENDPEHDFLIGLAYLDGIDTERDIFYGAELIKRAANDGLYEAMDKLQNMYANRKGVLYDSIKELYWCKKKYEYLKNEFGEEDAKTLRVMNELAYLCGGKRDFPDGINWRLVEKSMKMSLECRKKMCRVFGEDHPDTVDSLRTIAHSYEVYGDYEIALFYYTLYFNEQCRLGREKQPEVIIALERIKYLYTTGAVYSYNIGGMDRYNMCNLYLRKKYILFVKMYGKEDDKTLNALSGLAKCYSDSEYKELYRKINAYKMICETCLDNKNSQYYMKIATEELQRLYEKAGCSKEEIESRCKEFREKDESEDLSVNPEELKYLYERMSYKWKYEEKTDSLYYSYVYFSCYYADEMIRLYARWGEHKEEIEARRQRYTTYHNFNTADWTGWLAFISKTLDRCLEVGEVLLSIEETKTLLVAWILLYGKNDIADQMLDTLSKTCTCAGYSKDEIDKIINEITEPAVKKDFELGKAAVESSEKDISLEEGIRLIAKAATAGMYEAVSYMALYYLEKNNYKACEWYEIFYSWLKRLGDEHPFILSVQEALGNLYVLTYDYKAAVKTYQDNYEKRCRLFGAEAPETIKIKDRIETYKPLADLTDKISSLAMRNNYDKEKIADALKQICDKADKEITDGIVKRVLELRW